MLAIASAVFSRLFGVVEERLRDEDLAREPTLRGLYRAFAFLNGALAVVAIASVFALGSAIYAAAKSIIFGN